VAAKIIKRLVAEKAGRVTLMPLSKLTVEEVEVYSYDVVLVINSLDVKIVYPTDKAVRSLIGYLDFQEENRAAVQQVL
jgi:chromosome segregation ATPase